jgi:hypothetical protein
LGCATFGPSATFGDGRGFGIAPPAPAATPARPFRSETWDVALDLGPGAATIDEQSDSWSASNQSQSSPQAGQFLLMVLRSANLSGAEPHSVATMLREEDSKNGLEVTEISDAEFMGLPAALYASTTGDGVHNVTLLTVSGRCVYVLNVTRIGDPDGLVDYFGSMLGLIHTATGAPADAPACR